jgi:hypothetical protein
MRISKFSPTKFGAVKRRGSPARLLRVSAKSYASNGDKSANVA